MANGGGYGPYTNRRKAMSNLDKLRALMRDMEN